MPANRLSRRVLARLAQAEESESNPHYRDDLKIARLTVASAARGEAVLCSPHVLASYMVLGLHPEKVWPAIQARRDALGSPCGPFCSKVPVAPGPSPKKPAQSVTLWQSEKTNGARAVNSRAGESLLRDNTISVPMAAPSIAALYPNPDAPSSAKKRQYTLDELQQIVRYSGAPVSVRDLTLAALAARGPWPNHQGPATAVICVSIKGMQIEAGVVRSTIQRRIKRARKDQYWRRVRETNSWNDCPQCGAPREASKCGKCNYQGSRKKKGEFSPAFTYELDVEKFLSTPRCREIHSVNFRTYAEYKAAAKRGEHPNVTEMPRQPADDTPPPKSPAPARREEPTRRTAEYQRSVGRALGPSQRRELADRIDAYEKGRTAIRDVNGYLVRNLDPGAPSYIKPLPRVAAVLAACESMDRGDSKWEFAALRIPKGRAIEAAIEMGEVIPTGGSIASP